MLMFDSNIDIDEAMDWADMLLDKPYESFAQRSNRVSQAQNKRDDLRAKPIKRDKFALWASRHQRPTRHQLIKLAKRQSVQQ